MSQQPTCNIRVSSLSRRHYFLSKSFIAFQPLALLYLAPVHMVVFLNSENTVSSENSAYLMG